MEITGNAFSFGWEESLIIRIQSVMGGAGTAIASFLSEFGEEIVCVILIGLLYWCLDKEYGRFVGMNLMIAITVNPLIKDAVMRRRPYFTNPDIKCLKPYKSSADLYSVKAQGYSFPSGHATNSSTLFGSLALYGKKRWLTVIGIVIPFLCGISRFCLGLHYPTDVLAGWSCGVIVIFLVPYLEKKLMKRYFYAILLVISLSGFLYCQSDDYYSAVGLLVGFILAVEFEGRFVKFESTGSPVRCVLRLAGGLAVFFMLNTVLKLPFSDSFLESGTTAAHIVRSARYLVISFVDMGVYPLAFRLGDKLFDKKDNRRA